MNSMRNIKLYSAVSLDGYIAREDGNVDWLSYPQFEIKGSDYGYGNFYKDIDTTLMGYKTFEFVLNYDGPFPYPNKKNYVFTRQKRDPYKEVEFIQDDIVSFCQDLKAMEGGSIWLVGGGQINSLLIKNNLVDEIMLTVFPLILGSGIPLFPGDLPETGLSLTDTISYKNGIVQLHYSNQISPS